MDDAERNRDDDDNKSQNCDAEAAVTSGLRRLAHGAGARGDKTPGELPGFSPV